MKVNTSKSQRTLQLSIPKEVFNRLYDDIELVLPPSVLSRPNAKYKPKEIMRYLVMMCAKNVSHEGISQLRQDTADGEDVPTGACLLKRIGGSSYKETRKSCDLMLGIDSGIIIRSPVGDCLAEISKSDLSRTAQISTRIRVPLTGDGPGMWCTIFGNLAR